MTAWPRPGQPPAADRVRRSYDAGAAAYDARWAAYSRRSLALLRPRLAAEPPGRLLDVGCGTGSLPALLSTQPGRPTAYVGVDLSPAMLRAAGEKLAAAPFPSRLVAAPAERLPLPDAGFDTVVSASSLHDWPDQRAGLREMRRVVRAGGRLLLLDWCGEYASIRLMQLWLRWARGERPRSLTRAGAAALLEQAGFRVTDASRARIGPVWGLMVLEARAV